MKIVAFTGAGISKPSGIPTFQEYPELKEMLTRDFADAYPDHYQEVRNGLLEQLQGKEPNDAHLALAEYKIPIVTMNIDDLHEKAGSEEVIHIHGSAAENDIVLYGDLFDQGRFFRMNELMNEAEAIIIVGTSYQTFLAKNIRNYAEEHGILHEVNENAETELRKLLEKLNEL